MPQRSTRHGSEAGWEAEFDAWLAPFLARLPRKRHQHWAPRYVEGLLGTTARKNMERLADDVAQGDYDQLHHFLTTTAWDAAPLLEVLAEQAQALVGGPDAVLIVDDTSLLKQGTHSVGVARQYSGQAGKITNCQTLVSLTLAQQEVPIPVALRLFLPATWTSDRRRCRGAGIPVPARQPRAKWQLALEELDRVQAAGVTFGLVLADAGYGMNAQFRQALTARRLRWAVGIPVTLQVYPPDVRLSWRRKNGGRRKHPRPLAAPRSVRTFARTLRWQPVTWRRGTKGPLRAHFAAARVTIGDGAPVLKGWKVPSDECWLVGERRATGEERFYLTNLPATATLLELAQAIKARWSCEQVHQQLKEELGLDHFEGRSWPGLHHHVLLTMIAFTFLQHYRLAHLPRRRGSSPTPSSKKKRRASGSRRASPRAQPAHGPPSAPDSPHPPHLGSLSTLRRPNQPRTA
jgi:SRSO17 transposase